MTAKPARVIDIDSVTNRTYHYWHVFVPEAQAGQIYAYRVHGTFDPAKGMRFDPEKLLLDPYGRGVVVPRNYSRGAARQKGDNAATAMKSVVVDPHTYDWEGDTPLARSVLTDGRVRDACSRFHPTPQFRCRRKPTRHVRGLDREDPISS